MATLHGCQHCRHGNNCLAASDVALQQAVHRVRRGQVMIDFIHHSLLSCSYRKRQRTNETLLQLSPDFVANAGVVEFKCALATN